jgi:hypothetical protein
VLAVRRLTEDESGNVLTDKGAPRAVAVVDTVVASAIVEESALIVGLGAGRED